MSEGEAQSRVMRAEIMHLHRKVTIGGHINDFVIERPTSYWNAISSMLMRKFLEMSSASKQTF